MPRHCPECENDDAACELISAVWRCSVCGSPVVSIPPPVAASAVPAPSSFEDFLPTLNKKAPASKASISKLKRFLPDPRVNSLDPQVELTVSGLSHPLLALPAKFGPILPLIHERPLVFLDSTLKEIPPLLQSKTFRANSSIAIVYRGDISFVRKARICQEAKFLALIVVQSFPVWPFYLTDLEKEEEKLPITLPVFSVSMETGQLIRNHVLSFGEAERPRIRATLTLREDKKDFTCVICHEELIQEDSVVLQLPCCHYFHQGCILHWFDSQHSCPTCRFQLPIEGGSSSTESVELGY